MNQNVKKVLDSLTGGYSKIKIMRFTLVVCSLLDAAAHLYASPAQYPLVTFWLEIEVSAFIVIGIVFLLGLRIWYLPAILFTLLNISIYFVSGLIALPPVTYSVLAGHVQFANYSFGRIFSVGTWIYIIVVGFIAIFVDKGSKINELLKQDVL
ncbi:hypothetical protein [Caldiplasma sukawensis]